MGTLPHGQKVTIVDIQGRRARITSPLNGWVSLHLSSGAPILVPLRISDSKQTASALPDISSRNNDKQLPSTSKPRRQPSGKSWRSLLPTQPPTTRGLLDSALRILRRPSSHTTDTPIMLEETFYCAVCLENRRKKHAFRLSTCGHSFCKDCLAGYLRAQIENRQTHPVCFAPDGKGGACGAEVEASDIKAAADADTIVKYQHWLKKDDASFVECPKCGKLQRGDPLRPWMACSDIRCKQQFCFTHQTRHGAETPCAAFEASERVRQRRDRQYMSKHTQKCPRCAAPTEKNQGCNHISCYVCKTGWCWLCGVEIGNAPIPQHYRDDGPCRGRQFAGPRGQANNENDPDDGREYSGPPLGPWEGCCCVAIPSVFILMLSPLAFALSCVALLLSPISILILCVCTCTPEAEARATNCLRGFLQVVVLGPLLLVALPLWLPCFLWFLFVVQPRRERWSAEQVEEKDQKSDQHDDNDAKIAGASEEGKEVDPSSTEQRSFVESTNPSASASSPV